MAGKERLRKRFLRRDFEARARPSFILSSKFQL